MEVNHPHRAIGDSFSSAPSRRTGLAAKGRLHAAHPSTLANFAVNFVRNGRHVGGKQDAAKDPLSPACQKRHGISVQSYHAPNAVGGTDGWRQVGIANHKASIPDTACFRVDFSECFRTLNRRDRKIISALSAGETTSAVGELFRITPGRVSQLRRRFERDWCEFQGEAA